MVEKTFKEVIRDIKEGEVYIQKHGVSVLKKIAMDGYKNINFVFDGVAPISIFKKTNKITGNTNYEVFSGVHSSETYVLQRKEYSFPEAFEAYEKGIEIEECYGGMRLKKIKGKNKLNIGNSEFNDIDPEFDSLKLSMIRGKWYIND